MKHTTADCYNANKYLLDDVKYINDLLQELAFHLDLKPISPPTLIPYYYGKVREDIGISAYILLSCGHITIHTFPLRECYFLDVFSKDDFKEKKLIEFLLEKLPYDTYKSYLQTSDRKFGIDGSTYDKDFDFGPHLMIEVENVNEFLMEEAYDFLENIVYEIGMDPITRPSVIKDKINNHKYLSAIIIIAQSHISIHYDLEEKRLYFDIFSCMFFDYRDIELFLNGFGNVVCNILIPRGTKHQEKILETKNNSYLGHWQQIIK